MSLTSPATRTLDFTLLPLAVYDAFTVTEKYSNGGYKGGHFFLNVTAAPGGGVSLNPILFGIDIYTGIEYPILICEPITAVGYSVFKVYPGIGVLPQASTSDLLPSKFYFTMGITGVGFFTYSLSAFLMT